MAQEEQPSSPTQSRRRQRQLARSAGLAWLRTPTGRWVIVAWGLLMTANLLNFAYLSSSRHPFLRLAQKAAVAGFLLIGLVLVLRLLWRSLPRWWARPLLMLAFVCLFLELTGSLLFGAANPDVEVMWHNLRSMLFIAGLVFFIVGMFVYAVAAVLDDWRSPP